MAEKISAAEAAALRGPKPSSEDAGGLPPEDGLEILGPEPEVFVTARAGKVLVQPMTMGQVKQFLRASRQFLPALQAQLEASEDELSLIDLYREIGDEFDVVMSIALDLPLEELDKLMPDEYLRIATKVVVVNLDFFVHTLPATYGRAAASVGAAVVKLKEKRLAGLGTFKT